MTAKQWGTSTVHGEADFRWYGSDGAGNDKAYSLHVLEVDGKKPSAADYRRVSVLLSIDEDRDLGREVQWSI